MLTLEKMHSITDFFQDSLAPNLVPLTFELVTFRTIKLEQSLVT